MKTAYLVLDMQNDLVHDAGANGKTSLGEQVRSRGIVANTKKVIAAARNADVPIFFIKVGFSPDYREVSTVSPMFRNAPQYGAFKLGSFGTEFHPALGMQDRDITIVKHRVSPFYGTNLELILRAKNIEHLVMSGVSTPFVVQSAVREGHDRDFACTVVEDCCAAPVLEDHQSSIAILARLAMITTSDAVNFS